MRRFMAAIIVAVAGFGLPASAQTDSPVTTCSRAEAVGERVLCHETIAPAAPAEIWSLISTSEGWRTWAAPFAEMDLRSGGLIEASYAPDARAGDPDNIRNRVLAFVPDQLLVFQIAGAPPGFPHADLARELTTAIELEPVDQAHTRVRITMMGYRDETGFDVLYAFFDAGNAFTLTQLRERIAGGPFDWSAANVPEASEQ